MYIDSTQINIIVQSIKDYSKNHTVLLSIAEASVIDLDLLINTLNKNNISFFGGIFPRVIHNKTLHEKGIVITTLHHVNDIHIIKNIASKDFSIPTINFKQNTSYSILTFIDGLTSNISFYLSELYRQYGTHTSYFGGGAGSLSLQQQPCVFNNEGIFMDAAILCIMETKMHIGVKHGWKKIDGPIVATKTDRNVIQEINWMNAFDVYQSILKKDTDQNINIDNFFDIAKGYPFGIVKEHTECIVRDPIATNEKGELICVGEVLENTVLDVLKGENDSLIMSAKEAANNVVSQSNNCTNAFIIDCISRVLFLEDQFSVELTNVVNVLENQQSFDQIHGALTLGEISSYNGFLEFFNKTIVIGTFK